MKYENRLTTPQAKCYNALVFYIREHGTPPTTRELADILNVTPAAIMSYFDYLEEKGWIERTPKAARGTIPKGYKYGIDEVEEAIPENPYEM